MRILSLDMTPMHEILYLNARRGGGAETQRLPILRGKVDELPDDIQALLVASDLQGVVPGWRLEGGANRLLGEALAEELPVLADDGHLPDPSAVGAVLAGDLYAAPGGDKRGATGDVREVWYAFATVCRWVVGVAGNHDTFGTERERRRMEDERNIHLLDGRAVQLDGLTVGGVGGIMGSPHKQGRRTEDDFLAALNRAIDAEPALMVLHEGPNGQPGQPGDTAIRETLELGEVPVTICGHSHWKKPMAELSGGGQVVNVDARAILLTL